MLHLSPRSPSYLGRIRRLSRYTWFSSCTNRRSIKCSSYRPTRKAAIIIGVGFLMENAIYTVAKQSPNKKFDIIDGCATNPTDKTGACVNLSNVAPLFFKEQQAGCLVGAIAGQMEVDGKSKAPKLLGHNTIGAVGGLPIPPVTPFIAGYKFSAQKITPPVKTVL